MEEGKKFTEQDVKDIAKIMAYQMQKAHEGDRKLSVRISADIIRLIDQVREKRFERFIKKDHELSQREMFCYLNRTKFINTFLWVTLDAALNAHDENGKAALDVLIDNLSGIFNSEQDDDQRETNS